MLVARVAGGQDLADGHGRAVVEVGRRAPDLDQGGRLELVRGFISEPLPLGKRSLFEDELRFVVGRAESGSTAGWSCLVAE